SRARLIDDEAWSRALASGSPEDLQGYLDEEAGGRHRDETEEQKSAHPDAAAWETAKSRNTISDYDHYLAAWPTGIGASEATASQIGRASCRERGHVLASGSPEDLQGYLDEWPEGRHRDQAQQEQNRRSDAA